MAVIRRRNFSNWEPADVPKAEVYVQCNFSHDQPLSTDPPRGVRLFPGDDTPRRFEDCNLMNCEPPPGSQVLRCNTYIVEQSVPSDTLSDDVIEIDGVEVSRHKHYDRILHSRWQEGDTYEERTPLKTYEGRR